jgi:hypothetical protein
MTDEEIHNVYLHMSGKAEGLVEATGKADFPVLFARAILEYSKNQWQGLTDEEMKKTWYEMQNIMGWYSFEEIAKAIEAKLKEKNT